MDLPGLERRIRALELLSTRIHLVKGSNSPAGHHINGDRVSLLQKLEELFHEADLMKKDAQASGNDRLALACLKEAGHVLVAIGRLHGHLDGHDPTNNARVDIDADKAKQIAETYLARRKELENE